MYDYIFFDLDGVLTDSGEGIVNSALYALEKYNIDVNEKSELKKFIGPPLQDSFSTDYGFNEEELEGVIATFREYYSEKGIFENALFPNVEEVLKELKKKKKKLVVATSKPEVFTMKILMHFNILKYFEYVSAATLDSSKVKKDLIIKEAINALGIKDLSKVVMIGDRKQDVLGASKNGIECVGALWGYGSKEELTKAGATLFAESPLKLLELIK